MPEQPSRDILLSTLVSILRHFISILAAYLISKGLVASDVLSEKNVAILATGGASALVSLSLIVYQKLKTHRLVRAAQLAPPNTSIEIIKTEAASLPLIPKG